MRLSKPALTLCAAFIACSAYANTDNVHDYRVIARFALGGAGGWDYMNVDSPRHHLYVSRGDRVLVVDVDSGNKVGEIGDTQGVHGIALSSRRLMGFSSNGRSNTVTQFDLATLKTMAVIPVSGQKPDAIVYDDASDTVWTFNGKSHDASVIDPTTHQVVATVSLPGKPEFAASNGRGHIYVNIEDKSELAEIDSRTHKLLNVWPLAHCESPSGLAMDIARQRLFSVCDNQTMAITDAVDGHQVATVAIGDGPDAVVFDAAEHMIYSSNGESGTITAIHQRDADHYTIAATIPTQVSARTIALDPRTHHLFLSSAKELPAVAPAARPTMAPDSFAVLVVARH